MKFTSSSRGRGCTRWAKAEKKESKSFIQRLQCTDIIGTGTNSFVLYREVSLFGVSFIRGSTVLLREDDDRNVCKTTNTASHPSTSRLTTGWGWSSHVMGNSSTDQPITHCTTAPEPRQLNALKCSNLGACVPITSRILHLQRNVNLQVTKCKH